MKLFILKNVLWLELWIATAICLVVCVVLVILYAKFYPDAEFGPLDGLFGTYSIFMNQDADLVDVQS